MANQPRQARNGVAKGATKSAKKSSPFFIAIRKTLNSLGGGRGRRPQWIKDWEASVGARRSTSD